MMPNSIDLPMYLPKPRDCYLIVAGRRYCPPGIGALDLLTSVGEFRSSQPSDRRCENIFESAALAVRC